MSVPDTDIGAEREVDLSRWGRALVAQWWIAAAGLVVGALIGAALSLSGGSVYDATSQVAPGQAFNPSGTSPVLTYLTNEAAINEIARSATTLEEAARAAGMRLG